LAKVWHKYDGPPSIGYYFFQTNLTEPILRARTFQFYLLSSIKVNMKSFNQAICVAILAAASLAGAAPVPTGKSSSHFLILVLSNCAHNILEDKRDQYDVTMKCQAAYADLLEKRDQYDVTMKCQAAYADLLEKRDQYDTTMKCQAAYADLLEKRDQYDVTMKCQAAYADLLEDN
jgi:hypothetical protein